MVNHEEIDMADNPNVNDNTYKYNEGILKLQKDIEGLKADLSVSKKSLITTTKNTKKVGMGIMGIGSRTLLNGLAVRSPLLYMAKGLYEDVQQTIKERKALEKRLAAKQKRLEEEIKKAEDRKEKKAQRDEANAKKAEEKAAKKAEKSASRDASKSQAKLVKTGEAKQSATAISRDDAVFFRRYPELAGAFGLEEEKKQTAILKEMSKNQKQSAKKVVRSEREKEQKEKRSEFLRMKASTQKRGADGRFMKTTRMESLLEKMVKLMAISTAVNTLKSIGGSFFKTGILGGIFSALATIFNPKNLLALFNPMKVLGGLGTAFSGLFKIFGRLAGFALRLSTVGFAVVATLVGVFNAVDAFINTEGPLSKKLGAALHGFFIGVGSTFIASMELLFGKEKTWEVLNAYGKGVDKMIDGIKKVWNDPNAGFFDKVGGIASAIGNFVNDMFGGMFKAVGNALAGWELTVPYTNVKIKPFSWMASDTESSAPSKITPTASPVVPSGPVVRPQEQFTTTAPSRVTYESADALQRARTFNENSKIVAQGAPSNVNSTAPIMPVITNVNNSVNNGTVLGITSNIRDPDSTINRLLK